MPPAQHWWCLEARHPPPGQRQAAGRRLGGAWELPPSARPSFRCYSRCLAAAYSLAVFAASAMRGCGQGGWQGAAPPNRARPELTEANRCGRGRRETLQGAEKCCGGGGGGHLARVAEHSRVTEA